MAGKSKKTTTTFHSQVFPSNKYIFINSMNLYEIKKKNHKSEVYSLFYVQAIIFVSYYAIKLKNNLEPKV